MLDPGMLAALEMPFPPMPPSVVEERPLLSKLAQTAQRVSERAAASYDQFARTWRGQIDEARRLAASMPPKPLRADEREAFDGFIDEIEYLADQRAKLSARLAKTIARETKRDFAIDPSYGAVRRAFGERLLKTDREVVEAMLDYALFMRAFRAERIPDGRGGPTFSDPADMARYLDAALA